MASPPIRITLYDKAFTRLGWIGDPHSATIFPRHNSQPTAQFTLRSDHQMMGAMLTDGCRAIIEYADGQTMSGVIDGINGNTDLGGFVQVIIRDDWSLMTDLLAWPAPTHPITDQTSASYDTQTGPAETVAKYFIGRAVARLGLPVTIAPDLGRGDTITLQMRMTPLSDRMYPAVDQAGIGISVKQVGAGLVVDCYEPAWFPFVLTPESGIITAYQWIKSAPAATRVIAGGQGELTARVFRSYINTATEASWGLIRELFLDATDVDLASGLIPRAQAAALAGDSTTGLKLTLADTDTFHYGMVLVGDLVTTRIAPGTPLITDVLSEATINWNIDDGYTVQPVVSDFEDVPSRVFGQAINAIARRLSNYTAGR